MRDGDKFPIRLDLRLLLLVIKLNMGMKVILKLLKLDNLS